MINLNCWEVKLTSFTLKIKSTFFSFLIFQDLTTVSHHHFSFTTDNRTYHFQAEDEQECVM